MIEIRSSVSNNSEILLSKKAEKKVFLAKKIFLRKYKIWAKPCVFLLIFVVFLNAIAITNTVQILNKNLDGVLGI